MKETSTGSGQAFSIMGCFQQTEEKLGTIAESCKLFESPNHQLNCVG